MLPLLGLIAASLVPPDTGEPVREASTGRNPPPHHYVNIDSAVETTQSDAGSVQVAMPYLPHRAIQVLPVILPEQHHAAWLGETDDGNLKALLLPGPADQMRIWKISPQVNTKNDDVNTGSDRDDRKRLTRFDVAISHIAFAGSNDEPSGRKSGRRNKAL